MHNTQSASILTCVQNLPIRSIPSSTSHFKTDFSSHSIRTAIYFRLFFCPLLNFLCVLLYVSVLCEFLISCSHCRSLHTTTIDQTCRVTGNCASVLSCGSLCGANECLEILGLERTTAVNMEGIACTQSFQQGLSQVYLVHNRLLPLSYTQDANVQANNLIP